MEQNFVTFHRLLLIGINAVTLTFPVRRGKEPGNYVEIIAIG